MISDISAVPKATTARAPLSQLLAALFYKNDRKSMQSASLNPVTITLNALFSAGIDVSNSWPGRVLKNEV